MDYIQIVGVGLSNRDENMLKPNLIFSGGCVSAGGASDPEWCGTQPGPAQDPEGDGTEEGEDSWCRSLWHCLQGDYY